MVKALREADKALVWEVAKKHGVSDATMYAWHKRFGQLEAVDVKRLRAPEAHDDLVTPLSNRAGRVAVLR
jgi:putative transposase